MPLGLSSGATVIPRPDIFSIDALIDPENDAMIAVGTLVDNGTATGDLE